MKIGVMGHGPIVEKCLDAISKVSGSQAIAIYNRPRSAKEGEAIAKKYHLEKTYTDFDQFLNDAEIDTVYIALPNSLHYEYALKVLNAGKNAIVEKPFTSTVEETDHLIQVAKEKKKFLFEAITTCHLHNVKALKEYIQEIGELSLVQTNYSQYSSRYDIFKSGETPNIFNPQFSGGALMDINIYNIHFIVSLFGEPESVSYFPKKAENGIDTAGIAVLQYPNLACSAVGAKDSESSGFAYVQGRNGTLKINSPVNESRELIVTIGKDSKVINLQQSDNHLVYEFESFTKVVNEQDYDTCYKWLGHTRSVVQVVEKARKFAGIVFPADNK
ncbi:MAG: Gfo/Idh/MocA family oxidoreductase [Epulopiscium sp.]|nr:Gfo/Idh/MocA family oxidoreductase [Candidatus Epulonipiscium sp.]